MFRKMKKIHGFNCALFSITAAYLSVLWHAQPVQSCAGGRYGRYENWPSNSDWDELLMLITGKYGKDGWGWQQENSYAYSSVGDYPYGSSKYSSSPFDTSGSGHSNSNGISSGGYNSGSQYSSGGGGSGGSGSATIAKQNADKIREALNNFFKTKKPTESSKPSNSGWSSGGGGGGGGGGGSGGFIGESFMDSPRPEPPYPSHIDSPIGPGPPYNDNININPGPPYGTSSWSDGGSGPSPNSSPYSSGPPSGGQYHRSTWPGQQESRPQDYSSSSRPPQNSNYNDYSSNQLYSNNDNRGNSNGGGGNNQFQSDFETFGGSQGDFKKKRRRQGRRHPFANSSEQPSPPQNEKRTQYRRVPPKAGLPSRPVLMGVESNGRKPFKFPPYPGSSGGERGGNGGGGGGGARRGSYRRNRRMGAPMSLRRRMFNTKFGGYKVDHSRLRFG